MKTLKLTALIITLLTSNLLSKNTDVTTIQYNKVYRTERIGDAYHFLLLTKSGTYHHLYTNRTDKLTASEFQSDHLIDILKSKQSWGQSFPKKGKYSINKGKIYTKLLWNRVKVLSAKKIKYLNKIFYLQ